MVLRASGWRLVVATMVVAVALGACASDDASDDVPNGPATTEAGDADADADADADGSDGPAGDGQIPTAEVGECITDQVANQRIASFEVVDCDEPHVGELIHKFDLPDGDFPDRATVEAAVEDECLGATFEEYVGSPYETSEVFITPVTPTPSSWEQADDREVLCFATLAGGVELSESVAGSGR